MASNEAASGDDHPPLLSPSELGTKEYWETFYQRSLAHLSHKKKPGAREPPTAEYLLDTADGERDPTDANENVDDDDDPGTSWFTEHDAPRKVLRFLTSRDFPLAPCHTGTSNPPSILDLGTGNGSMLALLRTRGGFRGPMVGVDYSPRSIELARELQRLKLHSAYQEGEDEDSDSEDDSHSEPESLQGNEEEDDVVVAEDAGAGAVEAIPVPESSHTDIRFEVWDILDSEGTDALTTEEKKISGTGGRKTLDWFPYDQGGFDIVLDKGTFDAVSLSDEVVEDTNGGTATNNKVVQRRVCEKYPGIATRLVRRGGFLVVTSCNWTEEELIRWFTGGLEREDQGQGQEEDGLYVWGRVEYPRFRFGGQEGQGVCTVCFRRRGG
ncbi:hypothetical protein VTN02DRAFT_6025 [Thermoascus thermophilus]